MPTLARWLIKTALLHLVASLLLGGVRALQGSGWLPGDPAALWLSQLHLLTVGWITQLIFGVAYWLFPKPREGLDPWWDRVVWIGYAALNAGLVLRVLVEPSGGSAVMQAWSLGLAAVLQWTAGLCFVAHVWIRVRTK